MCACILVMCMYIGDVYEIQYICMYGYIGMLAFVNVVCLRICAVYLPTHTHTHTHKHTHTHTYTHTSEKIVYLPIWKDCNSTLQHTATQGSTLQHTATTFEKIATEKIVYIPNYTLTNCVSLVYLPTHIHAHAYTPPRTHIHAHIWNDCVSTQLYSDKLCTTGGLCGNFYGIPQHCGHGGKLHRWNTLQHTATPVAHCNTLQQQEWTRWKFVQVLQCVAVCCSVLQCVAVCCSVLQWMLYLTSVRKRERQEVCFSIFGGGWCFL